jgi:acetyl-CoA synthetase
MPDGKRRKGGIVAASESTPSTIDALFVEDRRIPPPPDFARRAEPNSDAIYRDAEDFEAFWSAEAERMSWRQRWSEVLDWSDPPFARWFVGGRLNITDSCIDRHLAERGDKVAFFWEGEPGDQRTLTYRQLHDDVCRFANTLADLGVAEGDRVAIYMGMVPELPVAMLACARLGAPHSVVFGGFSADSLRERINDAEARVLVTCDGAWRNGSVVPLKDFADEALRGCPSIEKVVVVRRTGQDVAMTDGRDLWWHDVVAGQPAEREAVSVDSEHSSTPPARPPAPRASSTPRVVT